MHQPAQIITTMCLCISVYLASTRNARLHIFMLYEFIGRDKTPILGAVGIEKCSKFYNRGRRESGELKKWQGFVAFN